MRSYRTPDRDRIRFASIWGSVFLLTGSLLFLGLSGMVDNDPETSTLIALSMVFAGCVFVSLTIRHLRKPVR